MSRAPGLPGVHFTLDRSGFFWSIRQPAVVHDRQFTVYLAPVSDRHRPLLGGLESREVERFQKCGIAGKYTALAVQPPVGGVQTLDGVGGIDNRPNVGGKLEDRADGVPVVIPALHGPRILLAPGCSDFIQRRTAFLLRRCVVNRFEVIGEGFLKTEYHTRDQ